MTTLTTQLERLETAQLVRREPDEDLSYLFKQGLAQESAYESLLVKKRRTIHHLIAEAYERLYTDRLDEFASLLAHHFAESGNDSKIVEYAVRAGDHAGRLSAEPEAGMHYAQALDALARLPDTVENRRLRVDILIKQTAVSYARASPEQNLANLREAALLVEDLLQNDGTSPGDRLRLVRVQAWSARMHFFRQERREALEEFLRVLPLAQELGDEDLVALILNMIARIWCWEGAFDRALPLLRQTLPALEQRQTWIEWTLNNALLGVALAARGDYHVGVAEAERALTRATDLSQTIERAAAYSMLALVHLMGGAVRPMLEASRAALQIGVPAGIVFPSYSAWGALAWAQSRLGQHQPARESMAQAEAIAQKWGRHLVIDDWLAAIKVEMALNAGQIEETIARAEEAVLFVRSADGKFAEGLVQRAWGEALAALNPPQWDKAEEHLASSLELLASGGAVLEAARTHVAWGQVMQSRGKAQAAREHFEKAAAQFESSGLTSELERTKELIAALPA